MRSKALSPQSSLLDWSIYQNVFSTGSMRQIFSENRSIELWLEVEAALVLAKADIGLIPLSDAQQIAQVALELEVDKSQLQQSVDLVGRPIIGIVQQLKSQLPQTLANHVHWGSTTQDVIDTALMLQMRSAFLLIDNELEQLIQQIGQRIQQIGDLTVVARTNGQHAQPIRLDEKLEHWKQAFIARQTVLQDCAARELKLQCGGAVGNLSAFQARDIMGFRNAVAKRLALKEASYNWQNLRSGMVDMIHALITLVSLLEQVATEVNRLSSNDIGELYEKAGEGSGASSAMPHKQNQRCSEFAMAIAKIARQRGTGFVELGLHEHERSAHGWVGEWTTIPEVFLYSSGAMKWSCLMFERLAANSDRMRDNLSRTQGLVFSEKLTQALASYFDQTEAKQLVTQASKQVREQNTTLEQSISMLPAVKKLVPQHIIAQVFHY